MKESLADKLYMVSIRIRTDNLMYLFYNEKVAIAVDTRHPETIVHALGCNFKKTIYTEEEILDLPQERENPRDLVYVLTTHGHLDHAGGNIELKKLIPQASFYNHYNMSRGQLLDLNKIDFKSLNPFCSEKLGCSHEGKTETKESGKDEEKKSEAKKTFATTLLKTKNTPIYVIETCEFTIYCINTPCHTLDSVSYLIMNDKDRKMYLVAGDFLFKLGCGKFFEGEASNFVDSLDNLLYSILKICIMNGRLTSKSDLEYLNREYEPEEIYASQYFSNFDVMEDVYVLYGHDYFDINLRFTEQFFKPNISSDFFLNLPDEIKNNPFINYIKSFNGQFGRDRSVTKLREMKDRFK